MTVTALAPITTGTLAPAAVVGRFRVSTLDAITVITEFGAIPGPEIVSPTSTPVVFEAVTEVDPAVKVPKWVPITRGTFVPGAVVCRFRVSKVPETAVMTEFAAIPGPEIVLPTTTPLAELTVTLVEEAINVPVGAELSKGLVARATRLTTGETTGACRPRVPPLIVSTAAVPKGCTPVETYEPPPLMLRLIRVLAPRVKRVPSPALVIEPVGVAAWLMTPVEVKVTPEATSIVPDVPAAEVVNGRAETRELVTSKVAGATVAEGVAAKFIPPAARVSPRFGLPLMLRTPALIWVEVKLLVPFRTIVPKPALTKMTAPLMLLETPCVSASPAPTSKVLFAVMT